ncbi:hypothetical protein DL96DRAFT_1702040 [Flagelloscypha sp. PMI_526]|nr:hypothetical protein DL96DRAFT_1702040 [Flagelloscypha sp. PMI_526]
MAVPNIPLGALVAIIVIVSLAIIAVVGVIVFLTLRSRRLSQDSSTVSSNVDVQVTVERQWDPEAFRELPPILSGKTWSIDLPLTRTDKSSLRGTEPTPQFTRPPPERVLHIAKEGSRWSTSSDSTIVADVTHPEPNLSFLQTDPKASPDKDKKFDDSRWSTATGATKVGARESMPAPRIPSIVVCDDDDDLDMPVMIFQASPPPSAKWSDNVSEIHSKDVDENKGRRSMDKSASNGNKVATKTLADPRKSGAQPREGTALSRAIQSRDTVMTELQKQIEVLQGQGYFEDLDIPVDATTKDNV